jgi:hypothetical protein
MGSLFASPHREPVSPRRWEPEPLQIPLERPDESSQWQRDRQGERDERDRDLPGSHVVVIDLA